MWLLPRDAMLARYVLWPCVRLSVCPFVPLADTNRIVPKRLNMESKNNPRAKQ